MYRLFNRSWTVGGTIGVWSHVLTLWMVLLLVVEGGLVGLGSHGHGGNPSIAVATAVFLTMLSFLAHGLYDTEQLLGALAFGFRLLRALVVLAVLLWLCAWLFAPTALTLPAFAGALALGATTILVWRPVHRRLVRSDLFAHRILVVGSGPTAWRLAHSIAMQRSPMHSVVGFLSEPDEELDSRGLHWRVLGSTSQAAELATRHRATRIVVADEVKPTEAQLTSLLECKMLGIPVEDGSKCLERLTGRIGVDDLRLASMTFSQGFVLSPWLLATKALADRMAAAIGLVLAAPILALAAIAIRSESRGPVFYHQTRTGWRGKPFEVWKLRSMLVDAEAGGSPRWAQRQDPRVTRVGRFLRKYRIDEIPQFWNVLRGEMSLVGPRPERPEFGAKLTEACRFYPWRHAVRPGLTGWAQINAPYAATLEESIHKLEYDLYYVKNASILLDLTVLASTVKTVFLGFGSR